MPIMLILIFRQVLGVPRLKIGLKCYCECIYAGPKEKGLPQSLSRYPVVMWQELRVPQCILKASTPLVGCAQKQGCIDLCVSRLLIQVVAATLPLLLFFYRLKLMTMYRLISILAKCALIPIVPRALVASTLTVRIRQCA